jgi:hypothetical protein
MPSLTLTAADACTAPQGCFRSAILSGFTGIQILNHVDDALHTTWRNLIDFDPLVQYGGYSYEDVVVRPAADALRTVTRPSTKVCRMLWFKLAVCCSMQCGCVLC